MHAHTSTFDNMAKITAYFSSSSSGRDVESLSKRSRIEGDGDKRPTVEGAIDGDSLPRSEGDAQSYTTGKHVVAWLQACMPLHLVMLGRTLLCACMKKVRTPDLSYCILHTWFINGCSTYM